MGVRTGDSLIGWGRSKRYGKRMRNIESWQRVKQAMTEW